MIAELADLKLAPRAVGRDLTSHASRIADESAPLALALARETPSEETAGSLLGRSFGASTLADLIALRDGIRDHGDGVVDPFLKWALLATLRDVAGVKVGWPYQRPGVSKKPAHRDVRVRFLERVGWMAEDLSGTSDGGPRRLVVEGDSRDPASWEAAIGITGVDGCVASPPYLNNFDYADATRLEAYFWGEAASWAELCTHIRGKMLTATTQQSSIASLERAAIQLEGSAVAGPVHRITEALKVQRLSRRRGKEYDRVVYPYFAAMSAILANLAAHTEPGAPVAWLVGDSAPYGVHIDTPALLGLLASDHGFAIEADVTLRQRGNRWRQPGNRHAVELSERLLVLSRS